MFASAKGKPQKQVRLLQLSGTVYWSYPTLPFGIVENSFLAIAVNNSVNSLSLLLCHSSSNFNIPIYINQSFGLIFVSNIYPHLLLPLKLSVHDACIRSSSTCLFPQLSLFSVICFEHPITRTFFNFPRVIGSRLQYIDLSQMFVLTEIRSLY